MQHRPRTIHCLGATTLDALGGVINAYPQPHAHTTGQVDFDHLAFSPGGGAANTCSALARMGLRPRLFSRVGDDFSGRFLLDELNRRGVDTANVLVAANETSAFTFVGMHPDRVHTFLHTPGANARFSISDLPLDTLFACDILMYQDFGALPALDRPSAAALLSEAKRRGVTTAMDEDMWPALADFEKVLPFVDHFLPGRETVARLFPGCDIEQCGQRFRDMGAGTVIIKMAQDGCIVFDENGISRSPSVAQQVVDTTGAGDSFDAGFLAGLATGLTTPQCIRLASHAAAAKLAHVGGSSGIPPLSELMDRAGIWESHPASHG